MIFCNTCKRLTNGLHCQTLYTLPSVLILILNRGKNNRDFNEEFLFPPILDFTNNDIIQTPINTYRKFYLCGVVTHLGESGSSGHFIAYCRNSSTSNFCCYNDAFVSEVSIETAISSTISNKD